MCIVHVSLVPIIGVVGEQKTKPTQHSVAVLRSLGLHPNLLACRCSEPLEDSVRQKLVGQAATKPLRAVWWLFARVVSSGATRPYKSVVNSCMGASAKYKFMYRIAARLDRYSGGKCC